MWAIAAASDSVESTMSTSWDSISSFATGAGTLVLAVATFASVRSANRAARVAEQALLIGTQPLLVPSHFGDPIQKAFYQDGRYHVVEGGRAAAAFENGVVYLAISLRNVGNGVAVLHGWRFMAGREEVPVQPPPDSFRRQGLDLLTAPGELGYWEAAFRNSDDPQYDEAVTAAKDGEVMTVDVLYGDYEGGQRVVTRFLLRRGGEDPSRAAPRSPNGLAGSGSWIATVIRHWNIDRPNFR
jgi:hypothetical protein